MTTAMLCARCSDVGPRLGLPPTPVAHCYGQGDTPGTKGLIGSGNYCPCECRSWPHQPNELWNLAASEHPDDDADRIARYQALMVEHGHLIPKPPIPEEET